MHDDFDEVGRYGDRTWAKWTVAQAVRGREITDCGHIGHKDSALQYITCQNPAKETEGHWRQGAAEKAWLGWWVENRDKTQEQRIQEGLAQYGALVHLPPSTADREPLLRLLGNTTTNRLESVPRYVKYNAFRWLRDSGFDPLAYALSNVSLTTPDLVKNGLVAYSTNAALYPRINGAGILSFGKQAADEYDFPGPYLLSPQARLTAYSLMVFPICAGSFLLIVSLRKKGKIECEPQPTAATKTTGTSGP